MDRAIRLAAIMVSAALSLSMWGVTIIAIILVALHGMWG